MPALLIALAFTFTRSAWIGACCGVGLLFVLRDFRLLALLPVALGLFMALAPAKSVGAHLLHVQPDRSLERRPRGDDEVRRAYHQG